MADTSAETRLNTEHTMRPWFKSDKQQKLAMKIGAEIPPEFMQPRLEDCKDSKGNWIKKIPESLTEQQSEAYHELKWLLVKDEDSAKLKLDTVTDSHVIRSLSYHEFNATEALGLLKTIQNFIITHDPYESNDGKDYQLAKNLKFNAIMGRDRQGRTNIFSKVSWFLPERITFESMYKYHFALSRICQERCPANLDQWNMICDM